MSIRDGLYVETSEGTRTLPDEVTNYLTRGTQTIIFTMPGHGVPDKPIIDRMRRDCFRLDLGTGKFDVLPLWKHGGGFYGIDGKRDKGMLAEAVGAICVGGRAIYKKKEWQDYTRLRPNEILNIISESI